MTRALVAFALAALLSAWTVDAAQRSVVSVPGTARPELLFTPAAASSAAAGALPLLVFLRGLDCAYTPAQIAALPGAAQVLANAVGVGAAKSGKDDIATLASAAADTFGAVAMVLTPPRTATTCTLCPAVVAAAKLRPADDVEAQFTLKGAELISNGTASGVDCPAWDAGRECCQASPAPRGDVDFVLGAIDAAIAKAPAANRSAVTIVGFSAGAFMALRLACDAPAGRVANVLAYAGSEAVPDAACKPPQPRGMLIMHGRRDLQIPFTGAPAGSGLTYPGAEKTLADWARRQRCSSTPQRITRDVSGSPADVVSFSGCAAPTTGWFLSWGHLPPRSSAPVFLGAIKQLLNRGGA